MRVDPQRSLHVESSVTSAQESVGRLRVEAAESPSPIPTGGSPPPREPDREGDSARGGRDRRRSEHAADAERRNERAEQHGRDELTGVPRGREGATAPTRERFERLLSIRYRCALTVGRRLFRVSTIQRFRGSEAVKRRL
ncbi:hypothetical protein [Halorubrum laminariae]|uniref:Uncharacterized protein n=1 Tax=Halorubrum laminariae TaxID=1433523 RepID=A0ABD6C246_9EURY|nr:hypothetical protein [Halorubrum laminariae]